MRPGNPSRPQQTRAPQQQSSPQMAAAMAGAVDLAAIKARSDAAARAAEAPPPTTGSAVVAITEENFQAEVIDRSFQVPVLLDLWADWCEPCKQLSPLLEKLAAEAAGAWVLATIDVEANQRISQALQVQSIPTVFAVLGGQVVPGFSGALPEAQVREFVDAVLQAASQAGLPGAPPAGEADGSEPTADEPAADELAADEPPADPRLVAAEDALEAGDFDAAAEQYQAILDVEPGHADAALALRQTRFLARVRSVPHDAVSHADAAPDDVAAQLAAADHELGGNDVAGAFGRLIGLVRRTHGDERDQVRDRLIDYFELLGPDEPRVVTARRELANALF